MVKGKVRGCPAVTGFSRVAVSDGVVGSIGMLFPARSATWAGGVTSFPGAGVEDSRLVEGQLLAGITVPKEAAAICRT